MIKKPTDLPDLNPDALNLQYKIKIFSFLKSADHTAREIAGHVGWSAETAESFCRYLKAEGYLYSFEDKSRNPKLISLIYFSLTEKGKSFLLESK